MGSLMHDQQVQLTFVSFSIRKAGFDSYSFRILMSGSCVHFARRTPNPKVIYADVFDLFALASQY